MIRENSKTARFLECVGDMWRWIRAVFSIALVLAMIGWFYILFTSSEVKAESPVEPPATHFDVEYYVEGTRYVRTMNIENAKLIEGVAREYGINPTHLLAMCVQEGSVPNANGRYYACDPEAVGDGGLSRGAFQIHTGIHKHVAVVDAKNIVFSARWTAKRLLAKGYKTDKKWAIQCHNSCSSRGDRYGDTVWAIAKTIKPISK